MTQYIVQSAAALMITSDSSVAEKVLLVDEVVGKV